MWRFPPGSYRLRRFVDLFLFTRTGNVSGDRTGSLMQNSSALFGMVSHCQTPAFTDFTGLTLSVYGSKGDICARRAGNGFGSQICRSPHDTPTHMNCASPKRLSASEEKAHLSGKTARLCFSLPPVQGRLCRHSCCWAWRMLQSPLTEWIRQLKEIEMFFISLFKTNVIAHSARQFDQLAVLVIWEWFKKPSSEWILLPHGF